MEETASKSYSVPKSSASLYASANLGLYHYDNGDNTTEEIGHFYGTSNEDFEVGSSSGDEDKGSGDDDSDNYRREIDAGAISRSATPPMPEQEEVQEKESQEGRRTLRGHHHHKLAHSNPDWPEDTRDLGPLPNSVWNKHFQVFSPPPPKHCTDAFFNH